jgi:concanavalin A-like lectin/glucanase superfamily protein
MKAYQHSASAMLATLLCLGGCLGATVDDHAPDAPGTVEDTPTTVEDTPTTGEDTPATGARQPDIASLLPPTGPHLWLRADVGVTVSSGTQVSTWLDQSGNGRNASMATATRRPTLVTGALNGAPVIRFGGAQSMYLDTFATPTQFTVFVVGKNSMPSESFSMILGPGGNSPNNQLRWENGSQTLFVGTGNNLPVTISPTGNTRVYHALSARYNGSTMTAYRDGSPTSTSAFTTSGPWTLASIGSWYSTYFLVGDLAEIIIYDRALSDAELASTSSYLRTKYNLP